MNVLNLYAGIGGNRKLWKDVKVTAVENDPKIAGIYEKNFPEDKVIIADAHDYLLKNYKNFEFIWSSPPCPTHSRTNTFLNAQGIIRYPDLKLYEEIIFLNQWFKAPWVVENVIPYYEPLVRPTVLIDRHYFWSNYNITQIKTNRNWNVCNARASSRRPSKDNLKELQKYHGFEDVNNLVLLRNCVNPIIGDHVFREAFNQKQKNLGELN